MSNIVMTGTDGDDVLVGADGNSTWFKGYDGNDTLVGANGNDVFEGGAGADIMNGGDGDDVFFYADGASPEGDTIDGGAGYDTLQFTAQAGVDLHVSLHDSLVANVERIQGGDGNDNFYGYSLSAGITMDGGAGRDYLQGGSGDDFLYGGADSDTLQGDGGNDIMYGGDGDDWFEYMSDQTQGADTIDGGDGFDTVEFRSAAGTSQHVDVGAIRNVERIFGGDGNESMDASASTEGIILDTGAGDDVLLGGAGRDVLAGGFGHDVISGGAGDDVIYYYLPGDTPAGDTIDGGDGYDVIDFYSGADGHTFVSLDDAMRTNVEAVDGGDGSDVFLGGGLTGDINMYGQGGNDYLQGGSGNDMLFGGTGSDTLEGGGGNDILIGGDGDDNIEYQNGQVQGGDYVDGGDGFDTVLFHTVAGETTHVDVAAFANVERIFGGDGDDTVDASATSAGIIIDTGNGNDVLIGSAGNDVLAGGMGSDVISGGDGDDVISYYGGATPDGDTIDGGAGFDVISLYTETDAASSLLLTDAMRTNIEQVSGGNGNDYIDARDLTSGISLAGGDGNDYLVGGHGDDILFGGEGHDFLKGSAGNDTLIGGGRDDIFVWGSAGGTWTVTDFVQGEDHVQVGAPDFDYVMQHAVQAGEDTQIIMDGSVMILQHVQLSSLAASDFFFGL